MDSDKKIFSMCVPYICLCKTCDPGGGGGGGGPFWPQGYNLNKLGKGSLGDISYQISKL